MAIKIVIQSIVTAAWTFYCMLVMYNPKRMPAAWHTFVIKSDDGTLYEQALQEDTLIYLLSLGWIGVLLLMVLLFTPDLWRSHKYKQGLADGRANSNRSRS
ncbi:MAG: hypothetical protein JSS27_15450 [Planctomycetes bacterium]|nr:hypothetical protein [Planctomycetota bacterium]